MHGKGENRLLTAGNRFWKQRRHHGANPAFKKRPVHEAFRDHMDGVNYVVLRPIREIEMIKALAVSFWDWPHRGTFPDHE